MAVTKKSIVSKSSGSANAAKTPSPKISGVAADNIAAARVVAPRGLTARVIAARGLTAKVVAARGLTAKVMQ
jgi:hypothetical protein